MGQQVKIERVNASFVHVFEMHQASPASKPAYSCEAIFPPNHPAVQILNQAGQQVALEKFGPDRAQFIAPLVRDGNATNVARQQSGKAPRPELQNMCHINASETGAVLVADEQGRGVLNTSTDLGDQQFMADLKSRLIGGVIVDLIVDVYGYQRPEKAGVTCGLKGIQLIRSQGEGVMQFEGGSRPLDQNAFGGGAPAPSFAPPVPNYPTPVPNYPAPAAPVPNYPAPAAPVPNYPAPAAPVPNYPAPAPAPGDNLI